MQLILFDDHSWDNLLPLTFTRPVSGLRVGILTIAEKWEKVLGIAASTLTREHLSINFPCRTGEDNLFINGSLLPNEAVVDAILALNRGDALKQDETLLAVRKGHVNDVQLDVGQGIEKGKVFPGEVALVEFPWKIFT